MTRKTYHAAYKRPMLRSGRPPARSRDLQPAGRENARGVLLRYVLQPRARDPRRRPLPPARAHAGIPARQLRALRDRRSDRDPQAVQRPPRWRRAGSTAGSIGGARAPRRRRDRAVRDGDDDRRRLRRCSRTSKRAISACSRGARASRPTRAPSSTRPAGRTCSFFRRASITISCRPATVTRRTLRARLGVSTDANAEWWGRAGWARVPHALIAAYGGDTVLATRKFCEHIDPTINVISLVDFDNDCVGTSLAVARALGPRLWGVRLDTSATLVDRSVIPQMDNVPADRRQPAARAQRARRARRRRVRARARSW